MPDRERVKELLSQATRLPTQDRAAFIVNACGADHHTAAEALDLLNTLDDPQFMSAPTGVGIAAVLPQAAVPGEGPGTLVGRYKLLQLIGEGGFGSVFLAEQTRPVHRRVALKIIKAGMDTKQVIARFEAERQALAMMDHPNIARVLDAGATHGGRPFFVMELVRGHPITSYCDNERLPIRRRLELLRDVCNAVQHAHQKGIIHRDLKPSNILITVADGAPIPKVIDFGIAKATAARLTDKTLFTEMHQLIGTPEYMSPEQAETAGIDIDTRSDIYSLGVLLYELLAGSTPLDRGRLRATPLAEIQRLIREEEPQRPSLRLATLAASRGTNGPGAVFASADPASSSIDAIAAGRRCDPLALTKAVRGDLDWIVMRCLEKDRHRRYPTASALADDVSRYLADQPVLATPRSRVYAARKLLRRNRGLVAAGAAIAATLVIATAVSIAFAFREAAARGRERHALDREVEQRHRADREAAQTRAVADFQSNMLREIDVEAMGRRIKDLLREQVRATIGRQSTGDYGQRRKRSEAEIESELAAYDERANWTAPTDVARDVIDRFVLDPAGHAVEEEFADQPLVQADLRRALGLNYDVLGLYEKAEPHLRAALELRRRGLGAEHEAVAQSLIELAWLLRETGDYAAAEALARESLAMVRKLLGGECTAVADCLNTLARVLIDKGDFAEAEARLRECLAMRRRLLGDEHLDVALSLNNLAMLLKEKGDYDEAETHYRASLAVYRRLLGDAHPFVAATLCNLAKLLGERGDYGAAEPLFREALAMRRTAQGTEHPHVATNLNDLGWLLDAMGDEAAAEPLFREALEMRRKLLGNEHPEVASSLNNLASLLQDKGDYTAAEPLYRASLAMYRRLLGDEHPSVARCMSNLASLLKAKGAYAEAEHLLREALAVSRALVGNEHSSSLNYAGHLGGLLRATGRPMEAIALLAPLEQAQRQVFSGSNALRLGRFLTHLGRSYTATGAFEAAEANLTDAHSIVLKCPGATATDMLDVLTGLTELYDAWHVAAPRSGYQVKATEWRTRLGALFPGA